MKYPIIVLGMHRSGTTMITKHLEKLGLFVGKKKEINNEAIYFMKLNDWVLKQCRATWYYPDNFFHAVKINKLRKILLSNLKLQMSSFRNVEFLGVRKKVKYWSIENLDFPWGWKDPRTTLTIDLWKQIFPQAKIIHIYRHPIDVSLSLRNRERKQIENFQMSFIRKLKMRFLLGNINLSSSINVLYLNECISLWEKYIESALFAESYYKDEVISIRYEDYLDNPFIHLKNIIDFIDLKIDDARIQDTVRNVDSSRKYAFKNKDEIIHLFDEIKVSEFMKRLGYNFSI